MQEDQDLDISQEDVLASFREERLEQRRKKPAILIGVSIGIVLALGIGWITFGRYVSVYYGADNGSLPVIRADSSLDGMKPETPGGMEVPNRDKLVYERLRRSNTELPVERLLPAVEKPKQPAENEKKTVQPAEKEAPSAQDTIEALTAQIIDGEQNNNNQSSAVIYEDDGTPVEVVFKEISAKENAVKTEEPEESAVTDKSEKTSDPAPAVKNEKEKPAVSEDRKEDFMVQLVSTRSESAAESEWKRLSKKYKEIIGDQPHSISKTVVSSGTFYRLRVGRFENRDKAAALCNQLKSQKQECFVVK